MGTPSIERIGRKQSSTHEEFLAALAAIEEIVPRAALDALIESTVAEIHAVTRGRAVGFGWSGGKDSIALRGVCELAGITRCCFGMSNLEYPASLQWVTDNMPAELEVFNNGWDLAWLSEHLDMLFPRDAATAGRWFKGIQHWAQGQFAQRHGLDVLLVGRRRIDGNFVGPDGIYTTSRGITRYSPIRDWSHEEVLAFLHYYGPATMPPCYSWPRGFRVGTGAWPARQWTTSVQHGWSEIYQIDPSIVIDASGLIESARTFLEGRR